MRLRRFHLSQTCQQGLVVTEQASDFLPTAESKDGERRPPVFACSISSRQLVRGVEMGLAPLPSSLLAIGPATGWTAEREAACISSLRLLAHRNIGVQL